MIERIPVMVYDRIDTIHPKNDTVYWLSRSGRVYDKPIGGTAWKSQISSTGIIGVYEYRTTTTYLVLREHRFEASAESRPANVPYQAPPIGLRPPSLAVLEYDKARCKEIGEAILRYAEAMQPVPQEWLDELSELTERNQPENQHTTETLQ